MKQSELPMEMAMENKKPRLNLSAMGLPLVIVAVVVLNIAITPNFFDAGTLNNLILQSFPCVMIGLGMTAVIATSGIDISVGSVMALGACVTAYMMVEAQASIGVAVVLGLVVSAGFGALNGFLISALKIQPTIMTLITMILARGFAQVISGGSFISLYGSPFVDMIKTRVGGSVPIQLFIMIIAGAVFWFIFSRLIVGKHIEAIGDNIQAARLTGINPVVTITFVYILVAVIAGFVGMIESARATIADPASLGDLMEMDVIAAVTIGGTPMTGGRAKVGGTVMGAILITLVTMTVNMNNIPYYFAYILKGIIIVVALYINIRNMQKRKGGK